MRVSAAAGRQSPFRPAAAEAGGRLEIARGDFRLNCSLRSGRGELAAAPREQSLDAALRSLLSCLLLRSGGLMLHSAALIRKGRAYVFPGRSGTGKSTLSRLAARAGAAVVSDEINLLRKAGGGWRVYGSPFWGEMRAEGRPGSWPLAGILLPVKAPGAALGACGRGEAMRALLRCTVNFERSPGAGAAALGAAADLLARAKTGRLGFARDKADFLELL